MNEKEAIALLKKHSRDEKSFKTVLAHSRMVQKTALKLAKIIAKKRKVDLQFIKTGSLLHDIGRFKCPPGPKTIFHGIEGAKILRKENLKRYASLAENHLGAGISKEDIIEQNLPLPRKDFVPKSLEEEIITYADLLAEEKGITNIEEIKKRFRKEVNEECVKRIQELHDKLMKLAES